MSTENNIERKRGDTGRIVFVVKDSKKKIVDVSLWTGFLLTVDPEQFPINADNNVFQIVGSIVDGAAGRIGFVPTGTTDIGNYFYDAQALDEILGKRTLSHGEYVLTQDITKD